MFLPESWGKTVNTALYLPKTKEVRSSPLGKRLEFQQGLVVLIFLPKKIPSLLTAAVFQPPQLKMSEFQTTQNESAVSKDSPIAQRPYI